MQIPTHILSGWCAASCFQLTPKERFFAMLAASLADLDGLGIFISLESYVEYHHVLAHNGLFGVLLATVLAFFSTHRFKTFWLYLALFHLHLILDYYGSGLGWGIHYLWPFSDRVFLNPAAWELNSWQNMVATIALLIWTVIIAVKKRRSPLEFMNPALDQKFVQAFSAKG